jgi:predicted transcriptional regulator of viral defense system
MFPEPLKEKIVVHFKNPLRYNRVSGHALDILESTRYSNVSSFIRKLQTDGILNPHKLSAKNKKTITLYSSFASLDGVNPYDMAMAMFPRGYFCNLSSIFYHSLTNQIPSSIYICNETISSNPKPKTENLNNNELRNAFIKPHRHTNYVFEFNNYEIVVVDREKDSRHGIVSVTSSNGICPKNSSVTSKERALIDAIVTPQYNGGITSVYAYFKTSKQKKINIDKLMDIYRELDFVYPYYQSIGFFFERLGMKERASAIYDSFPPKQKFYIDRNAKASWKYDDKWKLYYPKELVDEN